MKPRIRRVALLLAGLATGVALFGFQAPLTSIEFPEANAVIRLEFGLTGKEPLQWEGEITASGGEVLSTWGWHFTMPDRIIGKNQWHFRTTKAPLSGPKYVKGPTTLPPHILPGGVYVSVKAPREASFTVSTNRGDFSFTFAELQASGRLSFLDGNAAASYADATRALTRGEATQHDFPSIASSGDDVYVAWTAFHNQGNMVYFAHRNGETWNTEKVAGDWGDYHGSAVAVDGEGGVHVFWSEYADDRWRLVSRRYRASEKRWDRRRYVAADGRRQLFHRATTDSSGRPWLTWQEFSDGSWNIFASVWSDGKWSEPLRLSVSDANDWSPSVAAAPDGTVWVAWDGYEAGNYDIYLRPIRRGKPGDLVRVTRAPHWEAHATVAVDPSNHVWIAWEQAGPNWGKDTGRLGAPGEELHVRREIRLVRYDGSGFTEPRTPLAETLPLWMRVKHEYPQLVIGPKGLPHIFFRHFQRRVAPPMYQLPLKFGDKAEVMQSHYDTLLHMFSIYTVVFDGSEWGSARELADSAGRCWMQTGAVVAGGKIVYVWPVDGRTYDNPHVLSAQLRYADVTPVAEPAATRAMIAYRPPGGGESNAAPTEAEDLKRVRAVRWEDEEPLRLYRGELHRHTDISADGWEDGDILDAYRYASDAASLDFLTITDHSGHERINYYWYDWWRTGQIATMFDNPGYFTTFFGYERTISYPGGHRNIISKRRAMMPFRISDEEFSGVESYADRLYPELKRTGDIAIAHTTGAGGGTNWNAWDRAAEPVVEVFQAHRGSYEAPDSPQPARAIPNKDGLVSNAWSKGWRLGLIAASDHRSTHQSYACVYAPLLTREAIHDALKARRTFAATDNIIVKFSAATSDGRRYKMGEELNAAAPPTLEVDITGTDTLSRVELLRNSRVVLTRQPGEATAKFTFRDTDPPDGAAYYHLRIVQSNKMIAWSSPIWVDPAN